MPGQLGDQGDRDELDVEHNRVQLWIPHHGVDQDLLDALVVEDGRLAEVEPAQHGEVVRGEGEVADRGEAEEEVEDRGEDGRVDHLGVEPGAQLGSFPRRAQERWGGHHGQYLAVRPQEVHNLVQKLEQYKKANRHLFPK